MGTHRRVKSCEGSADCEFIKHKEESGSWAAWPDQRRQPISSWSTDADSQVHPGLKETQRSEVTGTGPRCSSCDQHVKRSSVNENLQTTASRGRGRCTEQKLDLSVRSWWMPSSCRCGVTFGSVLWVWTGLYHIKQLLVRSFHSYVWVRLHWRVSRLWVWTRVSLWSVCVCVAVVGPSVCRPVVLVGDWLPGRPPPSFPNAPVLR